MEKIQKLLDKSDDLLDEEMDHSQALSEDLKRLKSQYDKLESRHVSLSAEHEKLSYEFLQRKQDLEKLRASHDDLQKDNDSLLAQQISASQEEFVAPCLKCLERDNANSSAECSTAAIYSTVSVVSIPSSEETTSVTDKNAGLKELYITDMYKSLKGHQTLCDVLKKQILNRKPRKEGIAFERKLNADSQNHMGLLPKDLQLIHPLYLALTVILHILLMSHLTPTISYSKIRMVKYLLDLLVLTAGTVPL